MLDLWKGLPFWQSEDWRIVDEHLKDLDKHKTTWCPGRENLFRALELTPMESVRCCILGQDPYTDVDLATGLAFDVGSSSVYPPTIRAILKELKDDLDIIHSGNLEGWAKQGVLLWNVIPSCGAEPRSHDWAQWETLTAQILQELSKRNIVFLVLGKIARKSVEFINEDLSDVLWFSHPSPRGNINSPRPFIGSRCFSLVNDHLTQLGHEPIDWRL